jgi:hypothetical protein
MCETAFEVYLAVSIVSCADMCGLSAQSLAMKDRTAGTTREMVIASHVFDLDNK